MGGHTYIFLFILVVMILHDACDSTPLDDLVLILNLKDTSEGPFVEAAECLFKGHGTGGVVGKVTIQQKQLADGDQTHFLGEIIGLSPGLHGFHVHTKGDVGDNCKAAGGHFNPFGVNHGAKEAPLSMRHVGDLGNVEAGYGGTVHIDFWDKHALLHGNNGIMGKAIVIHQGEDDLGLGGDDGSITTGNAGPRAGCCIIEPIKDWKLR